MSPISFDHVAMVTRYVDHLVQFALEAKTTRKARGKADPQVVLVPMSGFKANALLLFPNSEFFIFIDEAIPFVKESFFESSKARTISFQREDIVRNTWWKRWVDKSKNESTIVKMDDNEFRKRQIFITQAGLFQELAFGLGEFLIDEITYFSLSRDWISLFLGRLRAYFDLVQIHEITLFPIPHRIYPYRCHGIIEITTGFRGHIQRRKIVYLQQELRVRPYSFQRKDIPRSSSSINPKGLVPIELLASVDAIVARGTAGLLNVHRFFPKKNAAIHPFLDIAAKNKGELIEGFIEPESFLDLDIDLPAAEVFPKKISRRVKKTYGIGSTSKSNAFRYSYAMGIRIVFFDRSP